MMNERTCLMVGNEDTEAMLSGRISIQSHTKDDKCKDKGDRKKDEMRNDSREDK